MRNIHNKLDHHIDVRYFNCLDRTAVDALCNVDLKIIRKLSKSMRSINSTGLFHNALDNKVLSYIRASRNT